MNLPSVCNVFEQIEEEEGVEKTYSLLSLKEFELEKIVSYGQATPKGHWYDQKHDEWVILVKGTAVLRFDGEHLMTLNPGDFLTIPANQKHRVDQCSNDAIWLALHMSKPSER